MDHLRGFLHGRRRWIIRQQRCEIFDKGPIALNQVWEFGEKDAVRFDKDLTTQHNHDFFRFP